MIRDIENIKDSCVINGNLGDYFVKTAEFLLFLYKLKEDRYSNEINKYSLKNLQDINKELYNDILGENYKISYGNPKYSVDIFGKDLGQRLSYIYYRCRKSIEGILSKNYRIFESASRLFLDSYKVLLSDNNDIERLNNLIFKNIIDSNEFETELNILKMIDQKVSLEGNVILNSDFSDLRYLYKYDSYITDREIKIASFFNKMDEEKLQHMVDTYVNGYIRGFEVCNLDISIKETVYIYYAIGFERMVYKAYQSFEKHGLKCVFRLDQPYYTNRQYAYDHRYDYALYFNEEYIKVNYNNTEKACIKYKDILEKFAGPAAIETFGEEKFEPINKKEAISLSSEQQKLDTTAKREQRLMTSKYLKRGETSFTIIAYPTPDIGENFEEIFNETIKLNNLDNKVYTEIQQTIIDVLDKSDYVHVIGSNGNKTNLKVKLFDLKNPEKETKFENCVADVNIPLGEVFTSPVLKGTTGKLHVKEVFLEGLKYIDLEMDLLDGMISSYTCKNFDNEEDNIKYIKENILYNYDTIPMGEFAIGTNTLAYVMGQKYNIQDKLPILIAEKTGPHFAMGDTCYSMSEDNKVFNTNGKEIVAKDNECSILRKTDISKAYFNCHTDITIPYNELGEISAYDKENNKVTIIKNGRFVLIGTEKLNEPLDTL